MVTEKVKNTHESLEVAVRVAAGGSERSAEPGLEVASTVTRYDLPRNLAPGTFRCIYRGLKTCLNFPHGL